jgi:HK97 gp10 family phage protein
MWFDGIEDLYKVAATLERNANGIGARASQVVRKSAFDVEAAGKQFAPVDTGNLRSSITTSIDGDGRSRLIAAEIGPEASYGGFVEWGTSRTPPQAYMGPALDRVSPGFVAAMGSITDPLEGA